MKSPITIILIFLLVSTAAHALPPQIATINDQRIYAPNTFTYQPVLQQGDNIQWSKTYGPDTVMVDKFSGKISYTLAPNQRGESLHIGIKASNSEGSDEETFILTIGSGNVVYVGPNETVTTLYDAFRSQMLLPGDTLVMRNGIYENTKLDHRNAILGNAYKTAQPPAGNANQFTTLIAEDPGQVIIDLNGEVNYGIHIFGNQNPPNFSGANTALAPRNYIAIKGFIIKDAIGPGIRIDYTDHIKLVDMGVVDSGKNSASHNTANAYIHRSTYTLIEGFYSWGHSRYKLQFKDSQFGVVRRSIARIDAYSGDQPVGGFQSYCSRDIRYQNNILIDSDHHEFWTHFKNFASAFSVAATGCWGYPKGIIYERVIGLNLDIGLIDTAAREAPDNAYTTWDDIIGWDINLSNSPGSESHGTVPFILGVGPLKITRGTFGQIDAPLGYEDAVDFDAGFQPSGGRGFIYKRSTTGEISNSILYHFSYKGNERKNRGDLFWSSSPLSVHHNALYENAGANSGALLENNIELDPLANGLKYLPGLDSLSSLQFAGTNASRVGAQVMTWKGKKGTFWGEDGWLAETHIPMWPFPNETFIADKFRDWSHTGPMRDADGILRNNTGTLTGNRGFAKKDVLQKNGIHPQTLTSYIWEYLGSPMPTTIYADAGIVLPSSRIDNNDDNDNGNTPPNEPPSPAPTVPTPVVVAPPPPVVAPAPPAEDVNPLITLQLKSSTEVLNRIQSGLSGITFNPTTQEYYLLPDNRSELYVYDRNLEFARTVRMGSRDGRDMEDLVYLSSSNGVHFLAIVTEGNTISIAELRDDGTPLNWKYMTHYTLPSRTTKNNGFEGIAYDAQSNTLYACQEAKPMKIYALSLDQYPSGGSTYDGTLHVNEPFDAQTKLGGIMNDISACYFHKDRGHLWLLSQASSKLVAVDLTGSILDEYILEDETKHEGLTRNLQGDTIIVSEPNFIKRYSDTSSGNGNHDLEQDNTSNEDTSQPGIDDPASSPELTGSSNTLEIFNNASTPKILNNIPPRLAGITFNPTTREYYVLPDNRSKLFVYDDHLNFSRVIPMGSRDGRDMGDLVYLSSEEDSHLIAIATEGNTIGIGKIRNDDTMLNWKYMTYYTLPPRTTKNNGFKGIAYNPQSNTLYACQGAKPMKIYTLPLDQYPTTGSVHDGSLHVDEPFDAQAKLSKTIADISACFYDSDNQSLWILSRASSKLIAVNLMGEVLGELPLTGATGYKGLTRDMLGDIILTTEPNFYQRYHKQK